MVAVSWTASAPEPFPSIGRCNNGGLGKTRLRARLCATRYCQVKLISATMDGWNLLIKVIGSLRKSSAMRSGSTIGSHSAFAMSKTCLPSAVSLSHTKQFDTGASSLGRPMLDPCAGNRDGSEISGTSMKCSLRSGASPITCGGRWIRMGTSLIFWSPSVETAEPQSTSFVRH